MFLASLYITPLHFGQRSRVKDAKL